jgi:hypothetical protein
MKTKDEIGRRKDEKEGRIDFSSFLLPNSSFASARGTAAGLAASPLARRRRSASGGTRARTAEAPP